MARAVSESRFPSRLSAPATTSICSNPEIDMASSFAARARVAALTLAAMLSSAAAGAQQPAAAPKPETGPKVGDTAPEFSLPGATRYGLLRDPVQLSSMKGKTVVLAFFIKARTRG